jgi:mannose-6-phosphate isomerase
MLKLYPLTFEPIFKERIWGGRNLETLYGKPLPPGQRVGESWEISDRPGDESVIARGPLQGKTLRWLMEQCPADLLGPRDPVPARFPLLIKIIDAQDTLVPAGPSARGRGRATGRRTENGDVVRGAGPGKSGIVRRFEKGRQPRGIRAQARRPNRRRMLSPHRRQGGRRHVLPSGRVHALGADW